MKPVGYAKLDTTNAEVLFKGNVESKLIPLYREPPTTQSLDKELLLRVLDLLEYITYHDGRYGQLESQKAYDAAYSLAKVITEKFEIKMYADRERTL